MLSCWVRIKRTTIYRMNEITKELIFQKTIVTINTTNQFVSTKKTLKDQEKHHVTRNFWNHFLHSHTWIKFTVEQNYLFKTLCSCGNLFSFKRSYCFVDQYGELKLKMHVLGMKAFGLLLLSLKVRDYFWHVFIINYAQKKSEKGGMYSSFYFWNPRNFINW